MVSNRFSKWLGSIDSESWVVIKRLSGNDTGLTGAHQAGIYFPQAVMAKLFPSIQRRDIKNPDCYFTAEVRSHGVIDQRIRAIYYNGKFFNGTRNEQRLTKWKLGVPYTPLQDPSKTGALTLFCFNKERLDADSISCSIWVCDDQEAEQYVENKIGPIEPCDFFFNQFNKIFKGLSLGSNIDSKIVFPESWLTTFPRVDDIIEFVIAQSNSWISDPDKRLLSRRKREFEIFRTIEEAEVLRKIAPGITNMGEFLSLSHSITNRRKARSGRSLERHIEEIFLEEGLRGRFGIQCRTEHRKKPDFIFPSCQAYHDNPTGLKLVQLAVKTTCKDRWRQILSEAEKIKTPFLFTLQEGISVPQFSEMRSENVRLVVPSPLHKCYPREIRSRILSLGNFIEEIKLSYR